MKEHALKLGKNRSLVGILTENGNARFLKENSLTGVLLLNAGDIHHVGPSRIYVKMARRLASEGFVVLRFDFSGIGDSGPRRDKLPEAESAIEETREVIDYLEQSKGIKKFCCVGFCAGAAIAARISVADPRIRKIILINPMLPRTHARFVTQQIQIYKKYALFSFRSWLRFVSMKSNYSYILRVVSSKLKEKIHLGSNKDLDHQDIASEQRKFFQSIERQGVKLLLVYSEIEFVEEYLQMFLGEEYNMLKKMGLLSIRKLKWADHLVTPLSSQEELLNLASMFLAEQARFPAETRPLANS